LASINGDGVFDRRPLGPTSLLVRELDLLAVAAREGPHGSGGANDLSAPSLGRQQLLAEN
jgi:hypothetical protein